MKKKNVKPGTKIGGGNLRTRTQNNIADSISGHRKKPMPVPGEPGSNIDMALAGGQVKDLLVDAANRDFRLKAAVEQDADYLADEDVFWLYRDRQPHFGVYPLDAQFYWIPGKRLSLPSHPIPADTASLRRSKVDLMWREAYKATSHRVFLTTKKIELESEQPHESLIIGHFENTNIARINLVQGETYFWRVDALVDETWQRGDIWSLKRELQK